MNNCTIHGQINPLWGPRASQNLGQTLWRAFLVQKFVWINTHAEIFHASHNEKQTHKYSHSRLSPLLSPIVTWAVSFNSYCRMKQLLHLMEETRRPSASQRLLPEGQIKSEAAGLKACQAPEGTKGGSSSLSSKIKSAFLFQNYFIVAVKALKVATKGKKERKKRGSDQWCHYSRRSGFSHSERSAETSTQHLQQSSKERVNWYEQKCFIMRLFGRLRLILK